MLLALDHGLTHGIVEGLESPADWIPFAATHGLTGVVLNSGWFSVCEQAPQLGFVLQTMGMPAFGALGAKVQTARVGDALRSAADAISVQLDFFDPAFRSQFRNACELISDAHRFEVPVLVMVNSLPENALHLSRMVRVCTEMGADIIKVTLPTDRDPEHMSALRRVVERSAPVLLAGGSVSTDFSQLLDAAVALRFSGVCVGRNIVQAADPIGVVKTIQAAFTG